MHSEALSIHTQQADLESNLIASYLQMDGLSERVEDDTSSSVIVGQMQSVAAGIASLVGAKQADGLGLKDLKELAGFACFCVDVAPGRSSQVIEELREINHSIETDTDFLSRFARRHPLIGMPLMQLLRNPERLRRPVDSWLVELVMSADKAEQSVKAFFEHCTSRLERLGCADPERALLQAFLEDFQGDVADIIDGCIHMGVRMACHAQQENCAVYTTVTPFRLPRHLHERTVLASRLRQIVALPVYDKYRASQLAGIRDGCIHIPSYMSVIDVTKFTSFLASYWEDLVRGLQPESFNNGNLHGKTTITLRGERGANAQPRIRLALRDHPEIDDFNLRIDRERDALSLDIGGIHAERALDYATELGELSQQHEVVMSYEGIVDQNGALSRVADPQERFPRGAPKQHYVSVMQSAVLSPGEKAALVASAVLYAGRGLIHQGEQFSYHLRGRLNKPEYLEQFDRIAHHMGNILR